MATVRSLSMIFVVVVLVASSCFGDVAYGSIPGKVRGLTVLKLVPRTDGISLATLEPGENVDVICRAKGDVVNGDPWWLRAMKEPPEAIGGWVPNADVQCQSTDGNVCKISLC